MLGGESGGESGGGGGFSCGQRVPRRVVVLSAVRSCGRAVVLVVAVRVGFKSLQCRCWLFLCSGFACFLCLLVVACLFRLLLRLVFPWLLVFFSCFAWPAAPVCVCVPFAPSVVQSCNGNHPKSDSSATATEHPLRAHEPRDSLETLETFYVGRCSGLRAVPSCARDALWSSAAVPPRLLCQRLLISSPAPSLPPPHAARRTCACSLGPSPNLPRSKSH